MIDKVEEVYNTTNVGMKTREQELDLKIVSVLTGIGHDMSRPNQNGRESIYNQSSVERVDEFVHAREKKGRANAGG